MYLCCHIIVFVSSHEVSTSVRNYISDILSALVQDAESLPQEVIDTILSNILEPKKVCMCVCGCDNEWFLTCVTV